MAKCDLCKKTIDETFLNKIIGTIIKIEGKQKKICQNCQKEHSMKHIKKKFS